MEKRTIWASGLVVLLLIGVVSVFAVSVQTDEDNKSTHSWGKNKHSMFGKGFGSHSGFFDDSAKLDMFKKQLNLSEDATKEDVLAALKEKKANWKGQHTTNLREKLALPEDATQEQVREAWKQKQEVDHAARLERVKAKLGLSEDASNEDVQDALQKWREENKDLLFGHGMRGFNYGMW